MTSVEILQATTNPKNIYEKKSGCFSINVPARKENAAEDSPLIRAIFLLSVLKTRKFFHLQILSLG